MKKKIIITNILFVLFIILENASLFYFFKAEILTQGKNAWCLFLSSILFGVVVLYKFYGATIVKEEKKRRIANKISYVVLPLAFVGGLYWLFTLYLDLFTRLGIDPSYSDIIPTIQVLCRRLLAGEYPYNVISMCGYTQQVTYLSMHWLPYTIAEFYKFDPRWVSSSIWALAAILIFVRSLKSPNIYVRSLVPVFLVAGNSLIYYNTSGILGLTIEIMIAGYYMMMVSGLNQKNGIIQGLFISLCLLSRYSLVLWLPLYAYVLYLSGNRKQLYLSVATVFTVAIFSYVIPFLSKDWSILYRGYKTYDSGAIFEWTRLQDRGINKDKPLMLFSGTGYAYFFYTRLESMDVLSRIKIMQKVHLFCSIGITVAMGIWYWYKRTKIDYRIFLMASFKIYLSVFLFLIHVPYEYLMITGNFVTLAIFAEQARYKFRLTNEEEPLANEVLIT